MSRKQAGWLIYGCLLLAVVFTLGYFAGSRNAAHEVQVTAVAPEVRQTAVQAAPPTQKLESAGLINLNTADEAALQTLPGIGPELAARIVTYRSEVGPFVAKEQVMDVKGIGEIRFAQMEPYITVEDTP